MNFNTIKLKHKRKELKLQGLGLKESSQILEAKHDRNSLVLEITFKRGNKYIYWPISREAIDDWAKHESTGKYFSLYIKDNPMTHVTKVTWE